MATKNPSAPLPFTTLIHMIIVKLSSANYLIWHSQILPLIEIQDLVGHVDGSIVPPPKFDSPNSQTPNDKYLAWKAIDQRLLCLLRSSLTEEALAEIVVFSTAHGVWLALETTFNHKYKTREIHLKDELQSMKRATRSVTDIARVFKGFCDQLHTIGRPVDNTDKVHWFLCGFGAKFSSFSSAQMALAPLPSFVDLVSRAKSFELFQKSFEPVASPTVVAAFTITGRNWQQRNQPHWRTNPGKQPRTSG
jgi:hypothetical protein